VRVSGAELEVLNGGGVGVVGLDLGVVHDELDLLAGDVERPVQILLVSAGRADPDPLAVEIGFEVGDVAIFLVDRRRGEVEDLFSCREVKLEPSPTTLCSRRPGAPLWTR
jgi:hypothetical protein